MYSNAYNNLFLLIINRLSIANYCKTIKHTQNSYFYDIKSHFAVFIKSHPRKFLPIIVVIIRHLRDYWHANNLNCRKQIY